MLKKPHVSVSILVTHIEASHTHSTTDTILYQSHLHELSTSSIVEQKRNPKP